MHMGDLRAQYKIHLMGILPQFRIGEKLALFQFLRKRTLYRTLPRGNDGQLKFNLFFHLNVFKVEHVEGLRAGLKLPNMWPLQL